MAVPLSEKALLFGESGSLVGVVTDPARGNSAPSRPGVVILNAGTLHRVGPNRLHVQLARALAEAGFTVLRFDLSGIGDSRRRESPQGYRAAAVAEIRQALDLLKTTRGLHHFLLFGICSGADNGLLAAVEDPRVVGATLVDGHNLPSPGYTVFRYRKRLLDPRGWVRLLSAQSELWSLTWERFIRHRRQGVTSGGPAMPTVADHVGRLRGLSDRGVHLLLAYTGNSPAHYNYWRFLQRQIRAWPQRRRVSVAHFTDSDHVFTLLCSQQRLVRAVLGWATGLQWDQSDSTISPDQGGSCGSSRVL